MTGQRKLPVSEPRNTHEANVTKFMGYVNRKHGKQFRTYEDLHRWSVDEGSFQDFWRDTYTWLKLGPPSRETIGPMLHGEELTSGAMFPPPHFFPTEELNITEMMLRNRKDEQVAIHFARETLSGLEYVSWGNLRERVRQIRSAMINSGVRRGDVVAAVISNSVHAIAIAMAALSIGAVWSSTSCDLGVAGIVDRYSQVSPKIVFADDGYVYAGKTIDLAPRIRKWSLDLQRQAGKLSDVVIIYSCNLGMDLSDVEHECTFEDFLSRDSGHSLEFDMVPFSHPAFILYSSGTTSVPKCIVHSTGGVALKVKADMVFQHDVRTTDVVFQYTTTSWVMWVLNFINLSCGCAMLLYDGSSFHPPPTILLELAEYVGVGVFGTSPRYLSTLKSMGIRPREQFNLNKFRIVTSTGSALAKDLYSWFYKTAFPPSAHLISMSGGTDIAGSFVGGTPLLPVYAGEIKCKALGMAVDVYDSGAESPTSIESSGAPGELGDFVQRSLETKGIMMLERSDGVLNPSGVRFGSAEIYAITDTLPELSDCLCIGQHRNIDQEERVLLFVRMKPGYPFTAEVDTQIRSAIRDGCSPRHVPHLIFEVADIPYTVNGKKCEINVKHIVNGRAVSVSGTVGNPEALKLYYKYRDLPVKSTKQQKRAVRL